MKTNIFKCALILLTGVAFTACYDLAELNQNPNASRDVAAGDSVITIEPDSGKYADIDIDFMLTDADIAELKKQETTLGTVFRQFFYEGYYNDYQTTTNLSHDMYSGYFTNNNPNHANKSSDYAYTDGWSAKRWEHFYNDRSSEYRQLIRTFHFVNPEYYRNAFYITRIYYAFLAAANTDTYGDMPFGVYARGRVPEEGSVPYETQEQVYDMMFRMLEQAVDSMKPEDASLFRFTDQDDRCYKGDPYKWLRFANTLRLRLALRISNVDPERAKLEGEAALANPYGLMESNDDNMQNIPKHAPVALGGDDAGGDENPIPMISIQYNGELVMSKDLEVMYKSLSKGGGNYQYRKKDPETGENITVDTVIDPRCLVSWFRPTKLNAIQKGIENPNVDFAGCERGSDDIELDGAKYSLIRSNKTTSKQLDPLFWFSYSRPSVWLGYSESLFLKAEAALRGWSGAGATAEELFRDGIRASMDYYEIDVAAADSYINGLVAFADGANPFNSGDREAALEQIITQKWLAVFPNGTEGWTEFRRTDYPALLNPLKNMSGGDVKQGKFIKRVNYPNSEYNNSHPSKPQGVKSGDRLWWDVADTNDDSGQRMQPNNFRSGVKNMFK